MSMRELCSLFQFEFTLKKNHKYCLNKWLKATAPEGLNAWACNVGRLIKLLNNYVNERKTKKS